MFIEAFYFQVLRHRHLHLNIEEGTIKFTSQWLLSQRVQQLQMYSQEVWHYNCLGKVGMLW